jgi:hypothetical protein
MIDLLVDLNPDEDDFFYPTTRDPVGLRPRPNMSLDERFQDHYVVTSGGCHTWIGTTSGGYGVFHISRQPRKRVSARRFGWRLVYGRYPVALRSNCKNSLCVNVDHMTEIRLGKGKGG